jgi:DNA-binding transcriptional MerR regulator
MLIGEVARRAGVSDKTLRYYEDIGVLDPPARSAGGYRDYDESVVDRLRFVRTGQSLGLSLGELREILALRERGQTPCVHVTDLITRRAKEIDEQIAELEGLRAELRRLARRAKVLDPKDCHPDKVCHIIE